MAKFKIGDKVRAKDPAWPGYQGHALGHDVYVVKKVDWDGTVKLDGFIDVWVSPDSLISANAARNADTPEGRRIIERAKGRFAAIKDPGQLANVRDDILRGISRSSAIPDDKKDALEGEVIYLHEQALRKLGFNAVRSRNAVVQKALNAVVAKARNDKWIDDFHVIVTAGKPDPALLEALKKKAAAWKAAKRNFSDKAAADAHDKATDDAMAIAKRLGARWIQQGAVTRVVMPNAARSRNAVVAKAMNAAREVTATNVRWRIITKMWSGPLFPCGDETYATKAEAEKRAEELRRADSRSMRSYFVEEVDNSKALNWNYKNKYQFFCVDPSMKAPCILSGWDYREDAKDDAAELKEFGIPHKIVSRRFLEQQGIDPNDGASWKKNRG